MEGTPRTRIVILGAGYAGLLAALRLGRRARRRGIEVVLVNPQGAFVERIRLHQRAAGQRLRAWPLEGLLRGSGVRLLVARAESIDGAARTVHLRGPDGPSALRFDRLLLAIGSVGDRAGVPGAAQHALSVAEPDGAEQIASRLPALAQGAARVVVVGGGLTGIETASELAEADPRLRVTILSAAPIGTECTPPAREHLRRTLARLGVAVRERATVRAVTPDGVVLESGERVASELVIWATGLVAPALAAESGLAVDERGRVRVDESLRSISDPAIFAVGDAAVAEVPGAGTLRMACATAMPMGAHAADVILRESEGLPALPFRFAFTGRCTSLGRGDGLVEAVTADDVPRGRIATGRLGRFLKEQVCRYTTRSLRGERLGVRYRWPSGTARPEQGLAPADAGAALE